MGKHVEKNDHNDHNVMGRIYGSWRLVPNDVRLKGSVPNFHQEVACLLQITVDHKRMEIRGICYSPLLKSILTLEEEINGEFQ
jgi:hypothetical protein